MAQDRNEEPSNDPDPATASLNLTGRGLSLSISVGILFVSLIYGSTVFPFWFDTNDDAAMLGISMGLFGDGVGDPRLIYQSAFLGAAIGPLFRSWPGVDWYSGLQCLACAGGFGTMGYLALRRDSSLLGIATVLAVTSAFLPPLSFNLQFTQTAFVCVMTGLVGLIDGLRRSRPHWPLLLVALAWMTLACLFRPASLVASQLALAVLAGLAVLDRVRERDRDGLKRDLGTVAGFAVALAAIVASVQSLESSIFYSEPEWQAFWTHLADRPYVLENWPRWIGLERIVAALETRLGITPEQYFAMVSWLPISKDLYSVEGFREMAAVIDGIELDRRARLGTLWSLLDAGRRFLVDTPLFRYGLGLIGLGAVLAAFRDVSRWGRSLVLGAVWMIVPCVFWLSITFAYRPPPPRVWIPLVALAVWCNLACQAVSAAQRPAATIAGWRGDRRGLVALLILGLALAGPIPVHAEFARVGQILAKRRANACAQTERQVAAFERLPAGATIYLSPMTVQIDCYLRPFHLEYPEIIVDRVVPFGWRNLTPWIRDELFAEESDLFDVVCKRPDNMFVADATTYPNVVRYLDRHEPEITLVRWADDLPPNILSCRRQERAN